MLFGDLGSILRRVLLSWNRRSMRKKSRRFSYKTTENQRFRLRKYGWFALFSAKMRRMIYVAIFFLFGIVLVNLHPDSNVDVIHYEEPQENAILTYVFYDSLGDPYQFDESTSRFALSFSGQHGAAFEKEGTFWKSLLFVMHRELLLESSVFSFPLMSSLPETPPEDLGVQIISKYKACSTPWWYDLQHGESVLAYEQEKNTLNICKIQRRVCFDGKLSGTFSLQSCQLNPKYDYFQEKFVVYNDYRPVNEPLSIELNYVEWKSKDPSPEKVPPKNLTIPVTTSPVPKMSLSLTGSLAIPQTVVDQTEKPTMDCVTPRGETVKDGLFVKAYKHKIGTNDTPCEVQLRACTVGLLEWTYKYASCNMIDEGMDI